MYMCVCLYLHKFQRERERASEVEEKSSREVSGDSGDGET